MREACGHLLSNTECPEYTQQVVHSEAPDGLATFALSTPKGLVASRVVKKSNAKRGHHGLLEELPRSPDGHSAQAFYFSSACTEPLRRIEAEDDSVP